MPRKAMGNLEKSKDFKGAMLRLFKSLSNYRYVLVFALVLGILSAILALIAPNKISNLTNEISKGMIPNINENVIKDIMTDESISDLDKHKFNEILNSENAISKIDELPKSIYDIIKPEINKEKVKTIIIFLICLYVLSAVLNYIQSFSLTIVSNRFAQKLRSKINIKINKLPLKYFDNHKHGDVLSVLTNDVDAIAGNMNQSLAQLVSSITMFIGSLVMMFYTNYIMALTAIVSSLMGFSVMSLILKNSQKYFIKRQKELGELNGYIEEIYSSLNVIKAYNAKNHIKDNFGKLNDKLFDSNLKSSFLSGLMRPIMGFIGNFGYVAVCIVGAILVMNNVISFGVIVAFIIYVRMFSSPLSQIAQAMTSLQMTAAASERAFEFLDEKEVSDESAFTKKLSKDKVKGKIEFKNVSFGYNENEEIIKDFSLAVNPGDKIAIVGPTGAGKTTLVNLLMKFYEINKGDILIDDVSIKELTRENIHDLFIMILQDTWLFNGTLRDNLKFNKANISDKKIMEICKVVGVDHFINTLPNALDYEITENDSISSGEKQLLTIARGMIEDAPFLILDEATSNVDTRTEELVQNAMDKLTKKRTSFIIAHRLSTIKNADLILVLKDGNIVEKGRHEELLKQNGIYAELYNSQFESVN